MSSLEKLLIKKYTIRDINLYYSMTFILIFFPNLNINI